MTWVYLNVTRNCFSVSYALEKKKYNDEKSLKNVLATYISLFEHVAPNTYIFWPKQKALRKPFV